MPKPTKPPVRPATAPRGRQAKAAPPPAPLPAVQAPAPDAGFPVVGIGASAGGLAAFEAFFAGMPADADPGMAFVLVQHLAPDHKSLLVDLVKRYTRMEVLEVEDGVAVRPNCAYIIPPNRDMAFLSGTLQLLEPVSPRGQRLPIDFFFRSLAQDQRERAIGIVLSGTGSDGTLGVRAIKGEGGMVMVQTPETTEYDGMPRSAIATGEVDFVLPPPEMAAQLIAYAAHAFGRAPAGLVLPDPRPGGALKKIFVLLRAHTGHDFSLYKPNTIHRRIERRMAVHQVERLEDYVRLLQHSPPEVDALFRDLLIGVTRFFRDAEAFEALEAEVIPALFEGKTVNDAIRVWVPGCSTGEEAYSIAILLQEHLETLEHGLRIQIFATDIDSRAIDQARSGIYAPNIAADLSPERLARFFSQEPGGSFRIRKGIRDLLVFSEQDAIKDPPFSRLDLVSCRNLLIYLGPELQKRLIPLFHYALNPGGRLFLGTSESVGEFQDLFATTDRKAKLYHCRADAPGAARPTFGAFLPPMAALGTGPARPAAKAPGKGPSSFRERMEQALLDHFAPMGAFVDHLGEVVYLHGRTGRYLEPSQGEPSTNLLKMAREGLRQPLATALSRAAKSKAVHRQPGVRVKTNGDHSTVDLTVRPLPPVAGAPPGPGLYLVVVEEAREAGAGSPAAHPPAGAPDPADAHLQALEQELKAKEEHLQSAVEELETSNEELKSSNEELQSLNEEMQSTYEELETSKEELQSVNEELNTVNTELQAKVVDLSRANNDLNNLMAGTGLGTLFVDFQQRIQRFTPAITQALNLIPSDVGRPVAHVVTNLRDYSTLVQDLQAVLDTLIPRDIEVQTHAGVWFLLRIRPYRTLENAIEGAVMTFTDISEMKAAQAALQKANSLGRLAMVVQDSRDAITVRDLTGRFLAWNRGARSLYGWTEAEALGMNLQDLLPADRAGEALADLRRLTLGEVLEPRRSVRFTKDGRTVEAWVTTTALVDAGGSLYAVASMEWPAAPAGAQEGGGQP